VHEIDSSSWRLAHVPFSACNQRPGDSQSQIKHPAKPQAQPNLSRQSLRLNPISVDGFWTDTKKAYDRYNTGLNAPELTQASANNQLVSILNYAAKQGWITADEQSALNKGKMPEGSEKKLALLKCMLLVSVQRGGLKSVASSFDSYSGKSVDDVLLALPTIANDMTYKKRKEEIKIGLDSAGFWAREFADVLAKEKVGALKPGTQKAQVQPVEKRPEVKLMDRIESKLAYIPSVIWPYSEHVALGTPVTGKNAVIEKKEEAAKEPAISVKKDDKQQMKQQKNEIESADKAARQKEAETRKAEDQARKEAAAQEKKAAETAKKAEEQQMKQQEKEAAASEKAAKKKEAETRKAEEKAQKAAAQEQKAKEAKAKAQEEVKPEPEASTKKADDQELKQQEKEAAASEKAAKKKEAETKKAEDKAQKEAAAKEKKAAETAKKAEAQQMKQQKKEAAASEKAAKKKEAETRKAEEKAKKEAAAREKKAAKSASAKRPETPKIEKLEPRMITLPSEKPKLALRTKQAAETAKEVKSFANIDAVLKDEGIAKKLDGIADPALKNSAKTHITEWLERNKTAITSTEVEAIIKIYANQQ
jgi:hypothetical protein